MEEERMLRRRFFPHRAKLSVMAPQEGRDEASHKVDYCSESKLIVQATLGDNGRLPLDRRSGAKMLYDVEQCEALLWSMTALW